MTMPPAQSELVDRVRAMIAAEPVQRETALFGGWAFMVNEKILVSAGKEGDLLVRIAAEDHEQLLEISGARQAEMGVGRSMGPGWITVSTEHLDDESLELWISAALEHNRYASTAESRSS